jgi:hypothetical protein
VSRRSPAVIAITVAWAAWVAGCGKAGGGSTEPADRSDSARDPGARAAAGAARPASPVGSAAPAGSRNCEPLPFAASTPVPEASGAAWITLDGKPALLVVGDSGNDGAYGIVDPESGATLETGKLPLSSEAGDDIEGVAAHGDTIYGLTSAGWVRVWQRNALAKGFDLVGKPYPLGPVDLPSTKNNNRAPVGDGMVCDAHVVNCGRNYEGLCLAARPRSADCIGFAASKADGHLYCLSEQAGQLVVHHDRAIAITRPGALADCAFSDDDTLWVGNNMFDLGRVYRVAHWDDPASATLDGVGALSVGFPELIAVRGKVVYRMSDMGGAPSLMAKFRCP